MKKLVLFDVYPVEGAHTPSTMDPYTYQLLWI